MTITAEAPTTEAPTALSLVDALTFVANSSSDHELDLIVAAVNARRRALREVRSAAVTIGSVVTIQNLSPAYLNGLTGTVEAHSRGKRTRVDVRLDEKSTKILRFQGGRFPVGAETTEYLLGGVPITSLIPS
jgi:hypothetical protein